jgi:hypothetical protein
MTWPGTTCASTAKTLISRWLSTAFTHPSNKFIINADRISHFSLLRHRFNIYVRDI